MTPTRRALLGAAVVAEAAFTLDAAYAAAPDPPRTYGCPPPGSHPGLGLPFSIWSAGPIPATEPAVVGMCDPATGYRAHFVTGPDPFAVYEIKVNSSVFNDTPGGRAHAVSVTWWRASYGDLPPLAAVAPVPGPGYLSFLGYRHASGLFLPRPASINLPITGGQTVTNTGAPWEDPIVPGEEPWRPIAVAGLVYGIGFVPESEGGVLPSTRYNVDWVARAVIRGNMHVLGTTIYVVQVR